MLHVTAASAPAYMLLHIHPAYSKLLKRRCCASRLGPDKESNVESLGSGQSWDLLAVCRVARVVAWLEGLAGQAFERRQQASDAEGGSLLYFGETQGLPLETMHAMGSRHTVTELDPDAATRCVTAPRTQCVGLEGSKALS